MTTADTLKAATDDYRMAQANVAHARARLAQSVREAVESGMSQSEASRIVGVDRLTIRKWIT